MLVRMPPEDVLEEGAAGGEDDLVGLHLVILARQGHVEEVPVVSEFLQRRTDVGLEIIPPQTKVVSSHLWSCLEEVVVTAMVAEDVQSLTKQQEAGLQSLQAAPVLCAQTAVWVGGTLPLHSVSTITVLTLSHYYEITQVASHRGKQYWRFSVSRTKHDMEVDRRILHCSFASSDIPQ